MSRSVIVIGGGIVGAATAWALQNEDVDVLVLEAGKFGRESTGKSAAIVRCHYSNPEVVRMAIASRETFRRLPLLLECDAVYHRTGWLFLVDEENAEVALANAEMQHDEGLDSVDVDDFDELLPGIDTTGVAYGVFEPDSGFADPVAATVAYVEAARLRGAKARENTAVEAIEVEGGRACGVRVGGELL